MNSATRKVLTAWFPDGDYDVSPLGTGYINQTFIVTTSTAEFVLQQLSPAVFLAPEQVLANQQLIVAAARCTNWFNYALPALVPTANQQFWQREGSTYWRLSPRIAPATCLAQVHTPTQARAAGQAFADYQRMLRGIDVASLTAGIKPVIPGFHLLAEYLRGLDLARQSPGVEAVSTAELALVAELDVRAESLLGLPFATPCLIHGDCKMTNLLFDTAESAVVGVIDLDTTMLGQWWWDFGDLVRSVVQQADADTRLRLFDAIAQGFFGAGSALDEEARALALIAPSYMTYMLCVRFLTDHLAGDTYFRVDRPGDNWHRAQEQFRLLQSFESHATRAHMSRSLGRFVAS